MICKKCGQQFEGNFCNNCGTPANKKSRFSYDKTRGAIALVSTIVTCAFLVIFLLKSPAKNIFITPEVEVDLPDLPDYYVCEDYSGSSRYMIKKVEYEITSGDSLEFTFSGEKTQELETDGTASPVKIQWKLYDKRDNVVAGGEVATPELNVGETFKVKSSDYKFDVEDGAEYTLVIESYKK